jgi:hypothetical protein
MQRINQSMSICLFRIPSYHRRNVTVHFTVSLLSLNAVKVVQECAKNNVMISQEDFFQLEFKQISCESFSNFWTEYQFVQYYLSYIDVMAWGAGVLEHFITYVTICF